MILQSQKVKLELPNAYTAAITDYMRNPMIEALDVSNYSGKEDEEIKVTVIKKDFDIQDVEVIIVNNNGEVIEEGKAKKDFTEWLYKTTTDFKEKEVAEYIIRVRDKTDNTRERRFKC